MSWLRRRWYFVALAVVMVGAVTVWLAWPSPPPPEQPRARQYLEFTACLLTDDQGVAGTTGQPVWAAMQAASLKTLAKVQYLAVAGPQTESNALPYANSLAQRHCDLIFAAGPAPGAAARSAANSFPGVRFYVITTDTPAAGAANPANIRMVRAQDVATVIQDAVASR